MRTTIILLASAYNICISYCSYALGIFAYICVLLGSLSHRPDSASQPKGISVNDCKKCICMNANINYRNFTCSSFFVRGEGTEVSTVIWPMLFTKYT